MFGEVQNFAEGAIIERPGEPTPQGECDLRRALLSVLAIACGCAGSLPSSNRPRSSEIETRCRLVGPLSGRSGSDQRNTVLDETRSTGPSHVVWVNPPPALIKTADGLIYACDSRL